MNPKRQFRQLRNDDRWIGLPPTASIRPETSTALASRTRSTRVTTAVAFLITAVAAIGLWAGLSGLHHTEPASLSPLSSTTLRPRPDITAPCIEPSRLDPIGCSTYTAIAAAGVPGGTDTWTGTLPPRLTLRVLNGKITALISTGCNGLTVPLTLTSNTMSPSGPAASTLTLCTGARHAQERWVMALFKGPISYTLEGGDLRLTAGNRSLDLTATETTTPPPSSSANPMRGTSAGHAPASLHAL